MMRSTIKIAKNAAEQVTQKTGLPRLKIPKEETASVSVPKQLVAAERSISSHDNIIHLIPIYFITGLFTAIFIFGPLLVRKSELQGIIRACIMLAAFCCYVFWITIYISQLNPLIGPRLANTTAAWMAYKWGQMET